LTALRLAALLDIPLCELHLAVERDAQERSA
jgi:hypothetical protein